MTVHEQVGLGVAIDVPENVSNDMLMDALVVLFSKPNEFDLPVTNVITRPSSDGLGIYREASLGGLRLHHNIYTDRINFEIRHVALDADGISLQEPQEEIINALTTQAGVRKLEFYLRDSVTGERKSWIVLKAACLR